MVAKAPAIEARVTTSLPSRSRDPSKRHAGRKASVSLGVLPGEHITRASCERSLERVYIRYASKSAPVCVATHYPLFDA